MSLKPRLDKVELVLLLIIGISVAEPFWIRLAGIASSENIFFTPSYTMMVGSIMALGTHYKNKHKQMQKHNLSS